MKREEIDFNLGSPLYVVATRPPLSSAISDRMPAISIFPSQIRPKRHTASPLFYPAPRSSARCTAREQLIFRAQSTTNNLSTRSGASPYSLIYPVCGQKSPPGIFPASVRFHSAFFFSLLSSCALATSTSVPITWPYSLTRLGSIR